MNKAAIDQLERLQRLREAGALTDEEFGEAKQSLLIVAIPKPKPWPVYAGIAVGGVVLAVGAGAMLGRDATVPPAIPAREIKAPIVTEKVEVSLPPARAPAQRLTDAFQAATGHTKAYTLMEEGEVVIVKPLRIIDLPFGPALLTSREIKDGCHACTGAIGVFYLREDGNTTTVTGRWPKAVEGWGWGSPPSEWNLTNQFTANPAIFASGGYTGQGVTMSGATLTELRPAGPATSDVIGTGYTDEGAIVDNERSACVVEGKIANIKKDASFDVIVTGSASGMDRYVKKNGRFVSVSKTDWAIPCGYP